MKNSELTNINPIGPGSELRAVTAKFIGHVETYCGDADRAAGAGFFSAAAVRLGGGWSIDPGDAVVSDGDEFPLFDSAGLDQSVTVTVTVVEGVATKATLPDTVAPITDEQVLTFNSKTYTISVDNGAVVGITEAAVGD